MGSSSNNNNNMKRSNHANPSNGSLSKIRFLDYSFGLNSKPQKQLLLSTSAIKDCCYDTSSDTSSVCSSVKSGSLLSSFNTSESSIGSIKKTKKRVRFNNNKFTSKKQVQRSVQTFDRVPEEDRGVLWWSGADLRARKRAEVELSEENDAAMSYLADSFRVLLHVTDDAATSSSSSPSSCRLPSLDNIIAGLDEGYRGLERNHGSTSVDRQFHCEHTVKDICRMYRRMKAAASKSSDNHADIDEHIRRAACKLTERSQQLAAFYGKVDAIVVIHDNNAKDEQQR